MQQRGALGTLPWLKSCTRKSLHLQAASKAQSPLRSAVDAAQGEMQPGLQFLADREPRSQHGHVRGNAKLSKRSKTILQRAGEQARLSGRVL